MLYLECNCNHTSASCFCAHSPLWGGRGREGKIGTPLHQFFYNMDEISPLSLLVGCYYPKCPRIFSCTMAEWGTSQLSSSSSDTESQEERDIHTPSTPIQNVNLSNSSTSSTASPVQTPKTKEINRLREENRRLKQQLEQVLSLQPDRHSEHDDGASLEHFKRENLSVILKQNWSLLITCYDYIGVEMFAARWSATKCEISTLNSPSCCHQLVQQLIIIG